IRDVSLSVRAVVAIKVVMEELTIARLKYRSLQDAIADLRGGWRIEETTGHVRTSASQHFQLSPFRSPAGRNGVGLDGNLPLLAAFLDLRFHGRIGRADTSNSDLAGIFGGPGLSHAGDKRICLSLDRGNACSLNLGGRIGCRRRNRGRRGSSRRQSLLDFK